MLFSQICQQEHSVIQANPLSGVSASEAATGSSKVAVRLPDVTGIPIPPPRAKARRQMHSLAVLIGGPAYPLGLPASNANAGMWMPLAALIILGTACSRPLLFEEAEEVQRVAKGAIIIARLDPGPAIPNGLSFDLLPAGQGTWFHRMCLWQEPFSRRLWLVPAEGQGPSAVLSRSGTELVGNSPFCSLSQREAGIACGAESLRLAGEVS